MPNTMTHLPSDSDRIEPTAFSQAGVQAVFTWLDAPPPINAADQLEPLLNHLATLRTSEITPQQRESALEQLYERGMSVVSTLLPTLTSFALPIPISRKTRQLIRRLQDLLRTLAEDVLAASTTAQVLEIHEPHQTQDLALWRTLSALAQHLSISNLAASSAGVGIWQQLHQTYATARRLGLASKAPGDTSRTLQNIYFSAILLGCAQPASFTSREIVFIVDYLEHFADWIELTNIAAKKSPAKFWIDPARDSAAVACSRKTPPPDTPVDYFSCDLIAALLKKQLVALEAGSTPLQINLPNFAGTPAGRGVIRRLITYWGKPCKRRFPRRRQNYRAVLCAGLTSLWRLFQDGDAAETIETSKWMITDESPDGYTVMHMSGKTGNLSVGDLTAIRTEFGDNWQICIIRWAQSENQEHLELGLQILATRAVPALLALASETGDPGRLSVLILPKIQALRSTEMLVVPSGVLESQPRKLVLVVEKENIEVREVRSTCLDEQNSQIEVFSIEPDTNST